MLLDPKVYICSRTGADKVGYLAKSGDCIDEFLSDDSEYDIYINGHTVKVERDYVLQDGDMVNAIHRPAGVETYIAVSLIVAAVVIATLPKPEKPNVQGTKSTSPNNQVSGQTNIARTGEGIPDIKGTIRAYPDLIQSAWYTWEENRRRVRERFCIGSSSLFITDIRDNEVDFDDIAGSSATVVERAVQSGDVYPVISDLLKDAKLEAENQRILELNYIQLAKVGSVNYVMLGTYPSSDISAILDLDNEADFEISGTVSSEMNKVFIIDKSNPITTDQVQATVGSPYMTAYRVPVTVASDFPTYDFQDKNNNDFRRTAYGGGYIFGVVGLIQVGALIDGFTGWAKLKYNDSTEASYTWYLNILFPTGLIFKNGATETINFRVQARDSVTLNAIPFDVYVNGSLEGSGSDVVFPITGRSSSEAGRTVEFIQQTSPAGNDIEFRIKRDSDINPSLSSSYAKIETVYSMNKYKAGELGADFTLIDVDARSDFTNKSQSSREINVTASRVQSRASYSGGWSFSESYNNNWFSDAVLSDFISLFGESRAQKILDLDSLYTAMAGVPDELKQFNYSFDDADISLGQRIHTACNAARVGAYRDGQVWRFYREESKPVTFHFDRRNIAGNAESQMSCRFQKPNDKDSIRLGYIDPIDNKERHIERRINGTNDGFEDGVGIRPLGIDLAGCRNTAQAVNRAELEVRRLVYQRRTVTERVLDDGLLVDIGDRVRWACIYDGDIVDGEVLEVSGTQIRISEKLRITGSLVGHITDLNGDVHGPYPVTAGTNGDFWIDGFDTSKAFIANNMPTQLGSRVIIGTTENLDYYDFTVTSKTPNSDGTVQLEMIEYNELMFSED